MYFQSQFRPQYVFVLLVTVINLINNKASTYRERVSYII